MCPFKRGIGSCGQMTGWCCCVIGSQGQVIGCAHYGMRTGVRFAEHLLGVFAWLCLCREYGSLRSLGTRWATRVLCGGESSLGRSFYQAIDYRLSIFPRIENSTPRYISGEKIIFLPKTFLSGHNNLCGIFQFWITESHNNPWDVFQFQITKSHNNPCSIFQF
jgi:hypothetical protein